MSVIVISGVVGVGAEIVEPMRQAGVVEQLKKAAGFQGHWSGPAGKDYRVFELWESRQAFQAWEDGTVKPNLPPGVQLTEPEFIDLTLAVEPG